MIETIKIRAKVFFEDNNSCHGWDHVTRVHKLCRSIGSDEGADLEILDYAAILHDIARGEEMKQKGAICHAQTGAERAKQILEEYDIPKEKIQKVMHCIQTHRYRGKNRPESLEAKILSDADKLDALGAVGIGRCFLFAGNNGSKFHDPDVDINKTIEYSKDDTAYREFLVKLVNIPDRLFTESSKKIAKERLDFMHHFFDTLNREWE